MTEQPQGQSGSFQYIRGRIEVGERGEYDKELIMRLFPQVGLSWRDLKSVQGEWVKGQYFDMEPNSVRAQILWGGRGAHAQDAMKAFEAWAAEHGRRVDWLEPHDLSAPDANPA